MNPLSRFPFLSTLRQNGDGDGDGDQHEKW